jgi:hypothetical protein
MAAWIRRVLAIIGALAGIGCFVVAFARAESAPELVPRPMRASDEELTAAAQRLAKQEPGWWAAAEREFPGDRWSQYDHFHNLEQLAMRREAARLGVPVGRVALAVAEELRRNPGERQVGTAPCKPRPFYM